MIKLRDIMTRDVLVVAPDLSIRDTMEMFAARHVSGAPVVAGGKLLGIVSATDLLEFAAALPGMPDGAPRSQARANWEELRLDEEDASDEEGTDDEAGENEPTSTFFTDLLDDSGASTDHGLDAITGGDWSALDEHTVSEAMTEAPLCTMPADATVEAAAATMMRANVHRVLVTDGPRLLGIVTTTDIVRAVSEHKLDHKTYVFDPDKRFDGRGWNRGVM